jgi:hypothetical protein
LWAVEGDPNTHGAGNLDNTTGSSVTINGKPIIVHGPDLAKNTDGSGHGPAEAKTGEGYGSVTCYGE